MITKILAVAVLAGSLPVVAQTVPDAFIANATFFDGRYDQTGAYTPPTSFGTFVSGPSALIITGGDHPSVRARGGLPASNYDSYATADLTYYFRLSGPGTDPVPMSAHVVASVHQTFDDNGVAASVRFSNSNGGNGVALGPNTGSGANFDYDGDLAFLTTPGELTKVVLSAGIIFSIYDNTAGVTGTAFADPFFTIDPTFAATHPGYSLAFSDGIGNAPTGGVPEPATWGLLTAGLGLAGVRLRRRRAGGVAAAAAG